MMEIATAKDKTNGTPTPDTASVEEQIPAANDAPSPAALSPEIAAKIAALRSAVRENFGKVVMSMMMLPRYRNQSLADLS